MGCLSRAARILVSFSPSDVLSSGAVEYVQMDESLSPGARAPAEWAGRAIRGQSVEALTPIHVGHAECDEGPVAAHANLRVYS